VASVNGPLRMVEACSGIALKGSSSNMIDSRAGAGGGSTMGRLSASSFVCTGTRGGGIAGSSKSGSSAVGTVAVVRWRLCD
jgi:hypothetical protein